MADARLHLGCCCACRAPFEPTMDLFYEPDCQAVLFLQNRFRTLSRGVAYSEFTAGLENGHLIPLGHHAPAIAFASGLTLVSANNRPPYLHEMQFRASEPRAVGGSTRKGQWVTPEPLELAAVAEFVKDRATIAVPVNTDLMLPLCKLCNDIWDAQARLRRVLANETMVPSGAIQASETNGGVRARARGPAAVPIPAAGAGALSLHGNYLGLLMGYYLHRCLLALKSSVPAADLGRNRTLAAALCLLPLQIACLHLEQRDGLAQLNGRQPRAADRGKGRHNYLGCIDLLVSYHLHLCARAEMARPPDLARFSIFYLRELPDCPAPVWDPRHTYLCDYVLDRAPPGDQPVALVQHVATRLQDLWVRHGRPLAYFAVAEPLPAPAASAGWDAVAVAYFASEADLTGTLLRALDSNASARNISYFIEHAGIAAVLWQIRRYLRSETQRLGALVDEWFRACLRREWTNIMDNCRCSMDMPQAQQLYRMQNALAPEAILGSADALGTGAEITLMRSVDGEAVDELLDDAGRCSVFKAAIRLRRWQFHVRAPPEPEDQIGAPYAVNASLITCVSLSARLIASSSDSTFQSGFGSASHGAKSRVARRRGCRGRSPDAVPLPPWNSDVPTPVIPSSTARSGVCFQLGTTQTDRPLVGISAVS